MRIVEIVPTLRSAGAERFVVDLSNELGVDNEVHLFVLDAYDEHDFFLKDSITKNVQIHFYENKSIQYTKMNQMIKSLWVTKKLVALRPDVVHTHIYAINFILPSLILRLMGLKFFHTVHSDAQKEVDSRIGEKVRRFGFNYGLINPVTISPNSDDSFFEFYQKKATLINNGRKVDVNHKASPEVIKEVSSYKKNDETIVLINVARISSVKRQELLSEVVSELIQEGENIILLIVGKKWEVNIVQFIENLHCPDIHLLGEKKLPIDYLVLADSFCLSSSYEGLPLSLLEAIGVGAIPICTPVGGIPNVITNGVNGFISEDISKESYKKAIRSFLKLTTEERKVMKEKAIASYAPYSMEVCAKNYLRLFETI